MQNALACDATTGFLNCTPPPLETYMPKSPYDKQPSIYTASGIGSDSKKRATAE